jgi:uncharacterized protein YjbI with pentapeptide repeats
LQSANLIGANLAEANLTRAILWNAQLDGANLTNADLEDAELDGSKLGGTDLSGANLIGADLQGADLVREDLGGANLSGADLTNAYLYGVTFAQILDGEAYHAVFDENTILPNGERWALGTDMTRFSDPNHPEFWKPLWVDSPGATWSQVQPDGDERPVRNLDN